MMADGSMFKHWLKYIYAVILLLGITSLTAFLWLSRPLVESPEEINVFRQNCLIAHAGGAIDGYTYTNSKEALINSLDKGFRYIELDLYETTDSNVVCLHGLEDYCQMTSIGVETLDTKTFLSHKLYGKYTPMTLSDAIKIWEQRPFLFVTDKISDPKILNKYFKNNRDKVYVEAFSLKDYLQLERDGYKPMLTRDGSRRGMLWFLMENIVYKNKVSIVTTCFASKTLLRIYKNMGVKVALFTVNDEDYVKSHVGKYVDFIYTDYLEP